MENQNSPVKVWAVLQINTSYYPDSLELDSIFFSKVKAEERVIELGGNEKACVLESEVQ